VLSQHGCLELLFPIFAATAAISQADIIQLPTVSTLITLCEESSEHLQATCTDRSGKPFTTSVMQQVGAMNPFVGGAAGISADGTHFTFPANINTAIDPRFGLTLQNILFAAFDTTASGPNPQALDGGDPISYVANGGRPIGAFMSDAGTDDDPIETETAVLSYTASHALSNKSTLQQTFATKYVVISPAEHGKPGEVPEPRDWMYSVAGLVVFGLIRYQSSRCRASLGAAQHSV
jgi:hypothetical protein